MSTAVHVNSLHMSVQTYNETQLTKAVQTLPNAATFGICITHCPIKIYTNIIKLQFWVVRIASQLCANTHASNAFEVNLQDICMRDYLHVRVVKQ
jgi:hypothetical protein